MQCLTETSHKRDVIVVLLFRQLSAVPLRMLPGPGSTMKFSTERRASETKLPDVGHIWARERSGKAMKTLVQCDGIETGDALVLEAFSPPTPADRHFLPNGAVCKGQAMMEWHPDIIFWQAIFQRRWRLGKWLSHPIRALLLLLTPGTGGELGWDEGVFQTGAIKGLRPRFNMQNAGDFSLLTKTLKKGLRMIGQQKPHMTPMDGDKHQLPWVGTAPMQKICFQPSEIRQTHNHKGATIEVVLRKCLQSPVIFLMVRVNTVMDVLPQEVLSFSDPGRGISQMRLG